MITTQVVCDECGGIIHPGQINLGPIGYSFNAFTGVISVIRDVSVFQQMAPTVKHLCGQGCVTRQVQKWMDARQKEGNDV